MTQQDIDDEAERRYPVLMYYRPNSSQQYDCNSSRRADFKAGCKWMLEKEGEVNEPMCYFIENKETKKWFKAHVSGYYGTTFAGESFGQRPEVEDYWTSDPNIAWKFKSKDDAKSFIDSQDKASGIWFGAKSEIEVTEHIFVNPPLNK